MTGNHVDTRLVFDISEEELPIFQAEADEQLQVLDEGLVRLEQNADDSELLRTLFRAAHTLKGSSGVINHQRMVKLTHAMETVLDGVCKHTIAISNEMVDTCLEAIDALRLLCDEIVDGQASLLDITPLVEQLNDFVQEGIATPVVYPPPMAQKTVQTEAASSPDKLSASDEERSPAAASPGAITVQAIIAPDSIASAARAFQVMLALQEMGDILEMQPNQAQIETATPIHELKAIFRPADSTITCDKVCNALWAVSEIERVIIDGIDGIETLQQRPGALTQPAQTTNPKANPRLGEILVANGLISPAQLQEALQQQKGESGPTALLGTTLIKMGMITQEVLDEVVSEQNLHKRPPSPDGPANGAVRTHSEKTVRTSVERLDRLMNLIGELITDRNRLHMIRNDLTNRFRGDTRIETLTETITHVNLITDQLQAEVMGIRMLPIAGVFNKFPRLVRDLARDMQKQVDLVIRGEDTELDRSVVEEISDPLIHLLRNAVGHGIESPADRVAAGKPERGLILLTAQHEQGRIILTIEDDGQGIDVARVKAKAVEKGKLSAKEAAALSDDEAIDLIYLSGLSTAQEVSNISGRGVGMDIVRNNLERINGSIMVETWPGRGTRFQIVLPLTLAIVPALLIGVGDITFVLPLVTVSEALRINTSEIHTVKGKPVIRFRDHILPVYRLSKLLCLDVSGNGKGEPESAYLVVVRSSKSQMGLIVDLLVGEQDVVVKSLGSIVGETTGISSATILGDGRVALILDVQGLFKLATAAAIDIHRPSNHKTREG